ncbi:MAG: ABC transporter substrate-binding protein [Acidobacteria bacterium]|nr:ABC transporter substrate-binding protein [Acidobacteriota bacterium]
MRTRIALALLAVLAPGCARTSAPAADLRVLLEADPSHLDPRIGNDQASIRLHQLLYSGLIALDDHGLPRAALAEDWEQEDPHTYTFRLRPGLWFHDGRRVTAADVAATFESVRTGAVPSYLRGDFDRLEAVETLDERTVRFRLREPFAPFLVRLTLGILPAGAAPEGFPPIGAGPYRLVEFRRGERVRLEAHPDHFRGAPGIRRVLLRIVPDETTRLLELEKGTADLLMGDLSADHVARLRGNPRYRLFTGPSWKYDYLGFNLRDPLLQDPRVRRAIAHGIDRQSILAHLLHGLARPATGMVAPDHWAFEGEVATYPFDPERARTLLDAAGYPDPDGPGPKPRLRLEYKTSNGEFARRKAAVFQEHLRKLGIELEVRALEWATFYADIRAGRFQVFSLTWTGLDDPDWYRFRFHSSSGPPDGGNRSGYRNPDLDLLLEAGARETDPSRRREVYSRVQKVLAEDLPEFPLWHRDEIAVVKRGIDGFRLTPTGDFAVLADLRRADGG